MEALREILSPQSLVKRDGMWQYLEAKYLVPGDLIFLKVTT
jgi:magnesium-transporting ATPase (P-type)